LKFEIVPETSMGLSSLRGCLKSDPDWAWINHAPTVHTGLLCRGAGFMPARFDCKLPAISNSQTELIIDSQVDLEQEGVNPPRKEIIRNGNRKLATWHNRILTILEQCG